MVVFVIIRRPPWRSAAKRVSRGESRDIIIIINININIFIFIYVIINIYIKVFLGFLMLIFPLILLGFFGFLVFEKIMLFLRKKSACKRCEIG